MNNKTLGDYLGEHGENITNKDLLDKTLDDLQHESPENMKSLYEEMSSAGLEWDVETGEPIVSVDFPEFSPVKPDLSEFVEWFTSAFYDRYKGSKSFHQHVDDPLKYFFKFGHENGFSAKKASEMFCDSTGVNISTLENYYRNTYGVSM